MTKSIGTVEPYAGNPHVGFAEGVITPSTKPRRGSLLYKKIMAMAFSAMTSCLLAGTYYADASKPDDSGDGLTPETAKKHIQAAVDLCASGSTVYVAEGVYDDGVNVCAVDGANTRARVIITNKVHLIASGSRDKTIIKGEFDNETETGIGANSVRCVYIYYKASTPNKLTKSAGSIVEGFTICNGAAYGSGEIGRGGGISMNSSYAVNCVISNCVAALGGGLLRGTAIRCLVSGCNSTSHGAAAFLTQFHNSILVRQDSGQRLLAYGGTLVNCTVAGNAAYDMGYTEVGSPVKCFNTVISDNNFNKSTFYDSSHVFMTNCVISAGSTRYKSSQCANLVTNVSAYGFAAPAIGDWRPSAEMGAAGAGDAAYLTKISLPENLENQRHLDYYGKKIPTTGAITCGAAQEVCAAERGMVKFSGNKGWEIDGFGALSEVCPSLNYIWTDDYPGMFKVRKVGATYANLIWYTLSTNGVEVANLEPDLENWTGLVALPGVTNAIASLGAYKVLYVDAEAETDEGATGSADNPYATIQAAVNAAPNNKSWQTSIIVRKGTYNKSEGSPGYRVRIWNKTPETSADWWYKRLRIVAEEGPGKTFIVGARGEGSDGTGSGAMGCCYVEIPSLVQGFTLTGGYKATGGAAAGGNSAGNAHYADCIITNNVGGETIAYQAQFTRCCIADNVVKTGTSAKCGDVTGGTATSPAVLLASEVVHSSASASGSYAIGRAVRVVFSTVSGACDGLSNWKNYYIGSIVPGGFAVNTTVGAQYCFAEGSALSGTTTGCSNGKSKCVSYHKGDFRLRDDSPCLGMVTFDVERYRSYATLDMDGNPLDLRSLAGNTAGAHQKWSVHYEPRGVMLIIH